MAELQRKILVFAGGGLGHVAGGVGSLMRYTIDVWAAQPDAPALRVVDTRGGGGRAEGVARFVGALLILLRLAATGRVALVHAHMTTRGSVARKTLLCALAAALRVPAIIHMHGADFFAFYLALGPIRRTAVAATLCRARHIVVVGQAWQDFLVDTVGVRRERVAIVVNGVPGPAWPKPARLPAAPFHILFLGRLGDRKGVPELIEALGSPALRAENWVATIAGDGEVPRFRDMVAQSCVADRVQLPGWADPARVSALLGSADLLVLPSHDEAMPIAVIEALAWKIPVIATPVGAIPEFLTDGVDARLVPPGDAQTLASAIAALIGDPQTCQRLAEAGHRVFCDHLDIRITADRLLCLYREAAAPQAGGRCARAWQPVRRLR